MRRIFSSINFYVQPGYQRSSHHFVNTQSVVKDTFDFLNGISGLFSNNKVMASFDVKSLFTNIPVQFTIDIILDEIYVPDVKTFLGLTKTS